MIIKKKYDHSRGGWMDHSILYLLFYFSVLFFPLKLLSFKFLNVDISLFKITALLFCLIILSKYGLKKPGLNPFFWIIILSVLLLKIKDADSRVLLNIINYTLLFLYFYSVYIYSSCLSLKGIDQFLSSIFRVWYLLAILAVPQLLLDLMGITISYEAIGEYAPENRGLILGFDLLRPNSFFGEPRDLSAIIIFTMTARYLLKGKISWSSIVTGLLIGILTQSGTFLLVLLFISAHFLYRYLRGVFLFVVPIAILGLIPLIRIASQFVPRIPKIDKLDLSVLTSSALSEQAGDFSFVFYLQDTLSTFPGLINLIFGNGLGFSNEIIGDLVYRYFPLKEEFTVINSRWLFYNTLVDFGFLICFGSLLLFRKYYKVLPKLHQDVVIFSLAFSFFTSNYFFILILLFLWVRNTYTRVAI